MTEQKRNSSASPSNDKSQELLPPGREPVQQGQQFDEMQRQHKNPDNTSRPKDPGSDHS